MTRYAQSTTVPAEQSRGEIERTLTRYGADQFMYGWDRENAVVAFRAKGRMIKFVLPMPDRNARAFTHTPSTGKLRSPDSARDAYEQAVRQRWRALALCIKAKLEAVEAQISTFEDEFLAQIVLPSGETAGAWMRPQIALAYERGDMPSLLPDYSSGAA
jgi:hypothetical protein